MSSEQSPISITLAKIAFKDQVKRSPDVEEYLLKVDPPRLFTPHSELKLANALRQADILFGRAPESTFRCLSALAEGMADSKTLRNVLAYGERHFDPAFALKNEPDDQLARKYIDNSVGFISGQAIKRISQRRVAIVSGYDNLVYLGFGNVLGEPEHASLNPPPIAHPKNDKGDNIIEFCSTVAALEIKTLDSVNSILRQVDETYDLARSAGESIGEIQRLLDRNKSLGFDKWSYACLVHQMVSAIFDALDKHALAPVELKKDFTESYWKIVRKRRLWG